MFEIVFEMITVFGRKIEKFQTTGEVHASYILTKHFQVIFH